MKLLSFGEIIWDVYPDVAHLGGAPLNLAAHAARQGAEVWLVSAVGDDDLGQEACRQIVAFGVKTEFIGVNPAKETGKCVVTLDQHSVPKYEILNDVAYDHIQAQTIVTKETFDVLAFGTLALRSEENLNTLQKLIDENQVSEIYCDLNIRPPFYSKEAITFCLSHGTIVKISDEEMPFVLECLGYPEMEAEKAVERLAEAFSQLKLILLTCGEKGSMVYDRRKNQWIRCDAVKTEVVSTVGAGDSFGATFLVQYMAGKEMKTCLKEASRISAFVVSKKEAVPEYQ